MSTQAYQAPSNLVRSMDQYAVALAWALSTMLHGLTIGVMAWGGSAPPPPPEKPKAAKVRILANPNGNPNITQTKVVEIAKPKPKVKPNTRAIVKQAEPEPAQEEVPANSLPQSFGDDPTGGIVGTGTSTSDGSQDGVNTAAEPIERVKPDFPQEAALKGIEGWVTLRFDINEEGRVENIEVVSASPRGMFEKKAREAVRKWKYAPRISQGQPVRVVGREVQIDFKLSD